MDVHYMVVVDLARWLAVLDADPAHELTKEGRRFVSPKQIN